MIEIIIMIGVVGNFLLQLSWFIWTLKNHSHKHIENNPDPMDQIKDFVPTPKSRDEVFSAEKRYDPNKIKGAFDELFK
jgi:hypothetical protein